MMLLMWIYSARLVYMFFYKPEQGKRWLEVERRYSSFFYAPWLKWEGAGCMVMFISMMLFLMSSTILCISIIGIANEYLIQPGR